MDLRRALKDEKVPAETVLLGEEFYIFLLHTQSNF